MKRFIKIFVFSAACLLCIGMGGGRYADSVEGEKLPEFFAEDKQKVFSAFIIRKDSRVQAPAICFYDSNDDRFRHDGRSVGQTYVNAYDVEDGDTTIRFDTMVSLEVMKNSQTNLPFFDRIGEDNQTKNCLKVHIVARDAAGDIVEYDRFLDTDIGIGYIGIKDLEATRIRLHRIDKIENIERMEEVPPNLFDRAIEKAAISDES